MTLLPLWRIEEELLDHFPGTPLTIHKEPKLLKKATPKQNPHTHTAKVYDPNLPPPFDKEDNRMAQQPKVISLRVNCVSMTMKNLSGKKLHFPKNINTLKNRDINKRMINHTLKKKVHENPSKGLGFKLSHRFPQAKKSGLRVRQQERPHPMFPF